MIMIFKHSSKIFLFLTRITGHNYKLLKKGNKIGIHKFYKNCFLSYPFLILQFIDQVLFILVYFYFYNLFSKKIIISDRGIPDTVIDWIIDTHKLKFSILLGKLLLYLLPRSYFIYLNRSTTHIVNSRPDVLVDDKFYLRKKLYKIISNQFFNVEFNCININVTIKQILKII